MIIIQNANVYAPDKLGKKDVLVAGGKILAIAEKIMPSKIPGIIMELIDASGKTLIPGLIDAHVHIAGAGGEGGPSTRTPEMHLSQMLAGGITSVVGCLGTDGITRDPQTVLMKAKALRTEGVSAWMYTGSYQVPTPTITGSIARDLSLIEEVIGVGEIALSDHRSSWPTTPELIRLAEEARVGGMLGGKAGIVNIHMGDAKTLSSPLKMQSAKVSSNTSSSFQHTVTGTIISLKMQRPMVRADGWILQRAAIPILLNLRSNPQLPLPRSWKQVCR